MAGWGHRRKVRQGQRKEVVSQKIGRITGWNRSGLWGENKLGDQREQRCMKPERRLMGKNKRRRAWGINSDSSQFRVTPQLIVQVRWSQVSSSNRRPLGITAVTEQLRPPSFSSVFHQPVPAPSKHNLHSPTEEFIIKAKRDTAARRVNVCV